LRTDDADYFAQMNRVFESAPQFERTETPADLAGILTDFERGFLAKGIQTNRAAFQLKS